MLRKSIYILTLVSTFVFADVTMCFKENISSPSQVEKVRLDGGKCGGKYTIDDMKSKGWNIKDVMFTKGENGLNYTYSFSKDNTPTNIKDLKTNIKQAQIEIKQESEKKEQSAQITRGKKLYDKKCAQCHGLKGEKEPYTSEKLVGMESETFEISMRDYVLGDKDNGMALIMKPYTLMSAEMDDVIAYLVEINVLKKTKED